MNTKKLLTTGLSTMMCISMLAGCSSSSASTSASTSSSSSDEAVSATIKVWAPQEDQVDDSSWLNVQLEAFQEAHPEWDLTFVTEVCSEGDVKTMVATDAEAAADVYLFANDQIPDLINSQAISELGGTAVDEINANNSETTVYTVTYDGSVYGVPFTANTWFMYYDKRVFSEEDVTNLDTMLEKGVVGFPLSNSWYIASFYVANGCTLFGEDGSDADAGIDFSGDKAVEVTNYLVDLVANPNFVDQGTGEGALTASALNGQINAYFSGTWDYSSVCDAIGEENVGIAAAPTYTLNGEEKQLKAFAGSKAVGVNAHTENPEIAVALARFLGGESAQQSHYDLRNIIPTISSIDVGDDALAQAQMDTMEYASIVQPLQDGMSNYWTPAQSMGEELSAGTVTHDNAAEKTEAMNEAMNTSSIQ